MCDILFYSCKFQNTEFKSDYPLVVHLGTQGKLLSVNPVSYWQSVDLFSI